MDRARATMAEGRRVTAWAMVQPLDWTDVSGQPIGPIFKGQAVQVAEKYDFMLNIKCICKTE
jgi:hypothetical protein